MNPLSQPTFDYVRLSNTTLHYMKVGSGPPLVIVPATISLIEQWQALAQFMGQRYTTYFFELPGHGSSSPYPEKFKSHMVPNTVAEFMDVMGHEKFNLMGFSFGGLLAMRTLEALQDRIENVFLLAPCVSKHALLLSELNQWGLKHICGALKSSVIQDYLLRILYCGKFDPLILAILNKVGNLNQEVLKNKNVLRIPQSSLDVLAYTVEEILSLNYAYQEKPFHQKCFFGMSLYDDLLDYDTTLEVVQDHFENLTVRHFTLPYHQPPETPNFEWLVDEFGGFLDLLPA